MGGEPCEENDMLHATTDLSRLVPGDLAAVLRSDGTWRYAQLYRKRMTTMNFIVDEEHHTKQVAFSDIKVLSALKAASKQQTKVTDTQAAEVKADTQAAE